MSFPEESRDGFHSGRFELIQPKGWGFRAGLDALLLAATVPTSGSGRAVDLGAGTGAVGFAIAARDPGLDVVLVERDPATAELVRRAARLSANAGFAERIRIVEADVLAVRPERERAGLQDGGFALAVTNPPFHPAGGRRSPDERRSAALAAPEAGFLGRWVKAAAALLQHGGLLALVARPDGLRDILDGAENRLGDVRLAAVHTRAGQPASRLLVHARKGSRAPLRILPPIVLRDENNAPLPIERSIGEGTARIDLGLA